MTGPNPTEQAALGVLTRSKLRDYARRQATWAEVEGMTWEEAKAIAQMGCELADAGQLNEAKVLFEGLVAGNPKDSASLAALGTVYQKLGRLEEAQAQYSAALTGDARNPVALAYRGELRLRAGDKRGCQDLVAAVAADPAGTTAAGRRAKRMVQALEGAPEKQRS